ncbi:MAG: hypothetical protein J6B26_06805 [Agathobacter sp.]|nr:hypothetical protein [Agathobacter sp.]
METIRNYLETMFAQLPNSPQVLHAKDELWNMMEDKYNELIQEGKSDNEAIAIVISEFGNLNELSEELGITGFMSDGSFEKVRTLSLQEAKDYIRNYKAHAFRIALGVLLCICSPVPTVIISGSAFPEVVGVMCLLILITCGVALFVSSGIIMSKWEFITKEACTIDFATAQYVHNEKENSRTSHAIYNTIGVVLCIVSIFPLILLDEMNFVGAFYENIGAAILLFLVSIAVFLFIISNMSQSCLDVLLKLNGTQTVSGHYVPSQEGKVPTFKNPVVNWIMSVYWPTATCLYLSWSFLTFDWHISWIIWPLAGILSAAINNICDKN